MRFYTSLHVETKDLVSLKEIVNSWLEPGLDAYVKQSNWIAIYAARLEEQSAGDVINFAKKLTELGKVVAFCVHDDIELAVFIFENEKTYVYSNSPAIFDLEDEKTDLKPFSDYLKINKNAFEDLIAVKSATVKVISIANILGIDPQNATQGFDELMEMEENEELSEEFILIEGPEANKPSLGEYFGRSIDE